jgi:hypothetical protein
VGLDPLSFSRGDQATTSWLVVSGCSRADQQLVRRRRDSYAVRAVVRCWSEGRGFSARPVRVAFSWQRCEFAAFVRGTNDALLSLFELHLDAIVSALGEADFVELTQDALALGRRWDDAAR